MSALSLNFFDTNNNKKSETIIGENNNINLIRNVITKDVFYIFDEGFGKKITKLSTTNKKIIHEISHNYSALTLNRDGTLLYVSFRDKIGSDKLYVIKTYDMSFVEIIDLKIGKTAKNSSIIRIIIDKVGFLWAVNGETSEIVRYDIENKKYYFQMDILGKSLSMFVSKNNSLYVTQKEKLFEITVNADGSLNQKIIKCLLNDGRDCLVDINNNLIILCNDGINSKLIKINLDTKKPINNLSFTNQLFYNLSSDSFGKFYLTRNDAIEKRIIKLNNDFSENKTLSYGQGSKIFNVDSTGYIHSEITGA